MVADPLLPVPDKEEKRNGIPGIRYMIHFLGVMVMATSMSCAFSYNSAVTCGVDGTTNTSFLFNENPSNSPVMYFPRSIDRNNFMAYSCGLLAALIGIMFWKGYAQVSTRHIIFVTSAIGGILTMLIPPLYDFNYHTTPTIKFIHGVCAGPLIPLLGHITSIWTPKQEIGMVVGVLTSYTQIGLFFLYFTQGFLCVSIGWRAIFYFHGGAAVFFAILWYIVHRDDLESHPWIGTQEKEYIKGERQGVQVRTQAPMKMMLRNRSVIACLIACFGNYNGITPFITYASKLFKSALNLADSQQLWISYSYVVQLVLKLLCGFLSDAWSANETLKLRLFNTISMGLCGILAIATSFIPDTYPKTCAIMICTVLAMIGCNAAGFNKAAIVVARQHAHALLTIYGIIITVSTILEPILVDIVAPESTWSQWFPLFLLHGSILVLTNGIFCLLIQGKAAGFTKL